MRPPLVRRIRANHGLEHATIAVLLEWGSRPPLGGNAMAGGFLVFGRLSEVDVAAAAGEALKRLRKGERDLAVSPYCGTNLAVGAVAGGLISGLLTKRERRRVPGVQAIIGAALVAALVGRPLGTLVQRHFTTSGDMGSLQITGVRRLGFGPIGINVVTTRYIGRRVP